MKKYSVWFLGIVMILFLFFACTGSKTDKQADAGKGEGGADGPGSPQLQGDVCSDANPWECNPVSNEGCVGAGVGCRWTTSSSIKAFTCEFNATHTQGQACDDQTFCAAGLTCINKVCTEFCCSDADCTSGNCRPQRWNKQLTGKVLGVCIETQQTGDPCGESNPWECNPKTNEGCTGDNVACAWTAKIGVGAFTCEPDATQTEGQACSQRQGNGPYCAAGLRCHNSVCRPICCGNEDCPESNCNYPGNWGSDVQGGNLGICFDVQEEGDPCAADSPWSCNPATNEGCTAGQSCYWKKDDSGFQVFACVDNASMAEGDPCNTAENLICQGGLACYQGTCIKNCCGNDDCAGLETNCNYRQRLGDNIEGGELGLCKDQQKSANPCSANANYPWECNPTSDTSDCENAQACTWTETEGITAFKCETGATLAMGQECSIADSATRCADGLFCFQGECVSYCCDDTTCAPETTCNYNDYFPWGDNVTGNDLGFCVDAPQDCPSIWNCSTAANCNTANGVGHMEYLCQSGFMQPTRVCCEPPEQPDAGVAQACEGAGFECMPGGQAIEGRCPGWIRYQMTCSANNQVCCELEPPYFDVVVDAGVVPPLQDAGPGTQDGGP